MRWAPASAFLDWKEIRSPAIKIVRRDNLTIASFGAFNGKAAALGDAVSKAYGVTLPTTPKIAFGKDVSFLWFGPDQWLAIANRGERRDLELELQPLVNGLASIVDQSDARAVVEISGARARDALAKGVPIDLHPSAFKPGDVAITHASHIGVVICQLDDGPTYQVSMFRSFADSFTEWLFHSCEEWTS